MAKKRRSSGQKTVYRTRTQRIKSYARGVKDKAGGFVSGLIAGAGGQVLSKYAPLGQWAQPAADIVTGHFLKSETLMTIGGRSIGAMLASGGISGSSAGSGSTGYAPVV